MEENHQEIRKKEESKSFKGDDKCFSGNVQVNMLFEATASMCISGALVSFEKGARTAWHTHPKGQRLIVTEGIGYTQEWGKPIQIFQKGDTIICPPGVKHWHGASKDCSMSHIALTGQDENGKNVDWLEKVTDEEYNQIIK
ncbi:cupin domain-containing protein [Helicobacter cappadocius]|uniref:Cupin domain-containing protein n=1 Tax=Helicobacter cappadocius TaxID=3063998 RepID=A0AA90SSC9_9HELI|nr:MULTISPECIES: cupin domain-containing protein [unclassified Helicobacter]MDO7253130.1 cupin domain-containing protein [Helicobacter sp. faydin-H75]MDP2538744.1 cupin domain-containing protein [Helicobacter sp. faydin-H76]